MELQKIVIFGATSAIASATARLLVGPGVQFFLVGKHPEQLQTVGADLEVRGAEAVYCQPCDLCKTDEHADLFAKAQKKMGGVDTVFIAHGILVDQKECEKEFSLTHTVLSTNTLSVISLLTIAANIFEQQNSGHIAVITSPAGERGRQSNYVYGASKGAVSIFLQGMRNRFSKSGVTILDIKPGFVSTPLTAHLPQGPLFVKPERVARDIALALRKKKGRLYTPWFWRYIMLIIRSIPEQIFIRLKL